MIAEKLKKWGKLGFVATPDETEKEFVKRIDNLKVFQRDLTLLEKKARIFPIRSMSSDQKILGILEKTLQVRPAWIPIAYSNRFLAPWEGAVSWSFDTICLIQLRKAFTKGRFLLYHREEVIFHEVVHALRFAFHEPRFEEILAYSQAKKKWRAFLGPFFSHPKHTYLFLILFALSFCFLFFKSLFFAFLVFKLGKLIRDQWLFKRAKCSIQTLFSTISPLALLIWLTDREIELFAKESPSTIISYIKSQKSDLRWQQLLLMMNLSESMT